MWKAWVQIPVGEKQFLANVDSLGEASTHNPGMSLCNVYNYHALTDCATEANWRNRVLHCGDQTHAILWLWELKSQALVHLANLAIRGWPPRYTYWGMYLSGRVLDSKMRCHGFDPYKLNKHYKNYKHYKHYDHHYFIIIGARNYQKSVNTNFSLWILWRGCQPQEDQDCSSK